MSISAAQRPYAPHGDEDRMQNHVITVDDKAIAEAIAQGLPHWFQCTPEVHQTSDGWGVYVGGILPENARLLMNNYGLGVLDVKSGRI